MAKVRRTEKSEWMENICIAQEDDAFLGKVKDWQDTPAWEEIAAAETEMIIYWSRWNELTKREGIRYYLWNSVDKSTIKINVPVSVIEKIMKGIIIKLRRKRDCECLHTTSWR